MATLILNPTDNAYVDQSVPIVAQNIGNPAVALGNTYLVVGKFSNGYYALPPTGGLCRSYVKFDLSTLPGGATVTSAFFGFSFYFTLSDSGATGDTTTVDVRVAPTTWTQNAITWNNQPTVSTTPIASLALLGQGGGQSVDATAATIAVGTGLLAFQLIEDWDYTGGGSTIGGAYPYPKEDSLARGPTLTINYTLPSTGKRRTVTIQV